MVFCNADPVRSTTSIQYEVNLIFFKIEMAHTKLMEKWLINNTYLVVPEPRTLKHMWLQQKSKTTSAHLLLLFHDHETRLFECLYTKHDKSFLFFAYFHDAFTNDSAGFSSKYPIQQGISVFTNNIYKHEHINYVCFCSTKNLVYPSCYMQFYYTKCYECNILWSRLWCDYHNSFLLV